MMRLALNLPPSTTSKIVLRVITRLTTGLSTFSGRGSIDVPRVYFLVAFLMLTGGAILVLQ